MRKLLRFPYVDFSDTWLPRAVITGLERLFGERHWLPYSLGLSIVCAALAVAIYTDQTLLGASLTGPVGLVVATASLVVSALLTVGWWGRRRVLMEWGLFISIGVWGTVAAMLTKDVGFWHILTWLAVPWVLISSGAWWLEVRDKEPT